MPYGMTFIVPEISIHFNIRSEIGREEGKELSMNAFF